MTRWLALTRPGYESEFSREFKGRTVSAVRNSGTVIVETEGEEGRKPWRNLGPQHFIFARQFVLILDEVTETPGSDLVEKLAQRALTWRKVERQAIGFHSLMLEAADNESGRMLMAAREGIDEALADRLLELGLIPKRRGGLPRLHLFLLSENKAILGLSDPVTGTPWPMGAPKIELPPEAPSRSARKLEEALRIFIPSGELEARVEAGMTAVDLGASPGGWTWQLARRGLLVQSVDNGDLKPGIDEFGLITHFRQDGYSFRPERPVDWLVCDIVGAAPRIARLVANWVQRGLCDEAIFNLKLGAGDRLRQVENAKKLILGVAKDNGVTLLLRIKHLYHDRDEVTGHLRILARDKDKAKPKIPFRKLDSVKAPGGEKGRSGGKGGATGRAAAPRAKKAVAEKGKAPRKVEKKSSKPTPAKPGKPVSPRGKTASKGAARSAGKTAARGGGTGSPRKSAPSKGGKKK